MDVLRRAFAIWWEIQEDYSFLLLLIPKFLNRYTTKKPIISGRIDSKKLENENRKWWWKQRKKILPFEYRGRKTWRCRWSYHTRWGLDHHEAPSCLLLARHCKSLERGCCSARWGSSHEKKKKTHSFHRIRLSQCPRPILGWTCIPLAFIHGRRNSDLQVICRPDSEVSRLHFSGVGFEFHFSLFSS